MGRDIFDNNWRKIPLDIANALGLNEALILSEIHHWLEFKKANPNEYRDSFYEGRYWFRNTMKQWKQNFPFWSESTIRRCVEHLCKEQVLLVSKKGMGLDNSKMYSIDYDRLQSLIDCQNESDVVQNENKTFQNDMVSIVQNESKTFQNERKDFQNDMVTTVQNERVDCQNESADCQNENLGCQNEHNNIHRDYIETTQRHIESSSSSTVSSKTTERKEDDEEDFTNDLMDKIIDDFNETCKSFPKVTLRNGKLMMLMEHTYRSLKSMNEGKVSDILHEVFERAEQSDFLTGRNGKCSRRFNFYWVLENAEKIMMGKYDDTKEEAKEDDGTSGNHEEHLDEFTQRMLEKYGKQFAEA